MRRGPGQRAGLTRAAVLDAARELIADRGVEGLSVRAVAGRLGVAPNALYSHVANRNDMVDTLLDDLLAEITVPRGSDPGEALKATMTATFDVVVSRPDLVPLYLARQGARGTNARALGATMTDQLADLGVDGPAAGEAIRVLVVFTLGFAALAGAEDAPMTTTVLRANLVTGLGWLLTGIVANGR